MNSSLMRMICFFVHQQYNYLNNCILTLLQHWIMHIYIRSAKLQIQIQLNKDKQLQTIQHLLIVKMTLYCHDNSSYEKTSELELSSKIQSKQHSNQDDEIEKLCQKISQMEKNYITMQRHYSNKIKLLYMQIGEKDQQFKKLFTQMQQIKAIAVDQKKKVQQLNKNAFKSQQHIQIKTQVKVKSKSPTNTARSSNNIRTSINNVETQRGTKSPSPKNDPSKKVSPTNKIANQKRTNLLTKKGSIGSAESGNAIKTSSEKYVKKSGSPSPKNSYQKSKKLLPKVDEVESIKIYKKTSAGNLHSFRQKPPAFK